MEKLQHAIICVISGWLLLFANGQFRVIYNQHSFIFLRDESAYAMTYTSFSASAPQSVSEKFHSVLSRKIAGNLRHADVVCVALFVVQMIALYMFFSSLGQLDSRKRN